MWYLLRAFALLSIAAPVHADRLRITTDILPIASVVQLVADQNTQIDVLIPPQSSPHDFAMTPATARMLGKADVVIWTGPKAMPWLARSIDGLAPNATHVALSSQDHEDDHNTTEPDNHTSTEHDDHANEHKHEHSADEHPWLDPYAVRDWLPHITEALIKADPSGASEYRAKTQIGVAQIDAAIERFTQTTAPLKGTGFVVDHDAFGGLVKAFGLTQIASLTDTEDVPPDARHLREVYVKIEKHGAKCLFHADPKPSPLARQVARDTGLKLAFLDPLASGSDTGIQTYPAHLDQLAHALATCLND